MRSTSVGVTVRFAVLTQLLKSTVNMYLRSVAVETFSPTAKLNRVGDALSAVNHNKQTKYVVRATGDAYQKIVAFLDAHYSGGSGRRDWHQMLGLQPVAHPHTGDVAWVCDRHRHAYLARAASSSGTQATPAYP